MYLTNESGECLLNISSYIKNHEKNLMKMYKNVVINTKEGSAKQQIYNILKDEEDIIKEI
ncbi:MAG: hypothetical protein ACRCW0_10415 [Clostridium sp.]